MSSTLAAVLLILLVSGCSGHPPGPGVEDGCPESPLLDELRRAGSLNVIVRLDLDTQPEAGLGEQAVQEQRRAIAQVQDALVAELDDLDDLDVTVLRRYERFPQLALLVSEPALCRLLSSPLVRNVEADREAAPG